MTRADPACALNVLQKIKRQRAMSPDLTAETTIRHYYIDGLNAGDRMFPDRLASHLLGRASPSMVWLDPFDQIVLAIEGTGDAPAEEWQDRIEDVASAPERIDLVRQVVSGAGRRFAASLTEGLVSAVPISCAERGLAMLEDGGRVRPGRIGWLWELSGRGAVPVLTTLLPDSLDKLHYVTPYKVLLSMLLSRSSTADVVLFGQLPERESGAGDADVTGAGGPLRYSDSRASDALKNVARIIPMQVSDLG